MLRRRLGAMSSEREKSRLALSKRSLCVSSRFSVSVLFLYACASGGYLCARAVLLISNSDEYRDAFCLFLRLRFFDLSILDLPSILRWKTEGSCGRKALKKTEALENARKKFPFLFFCFCSLLRDVTRAAVLSPRVFLSLTKALSRLSNFSSLSRSRGVLSPHTTTAIKEEVFVLFCDNNTTHLFIHTTRKKRERKKKKKFLSWEQLQTQRRKRRQTTISCERTKTRCDRSCISCSLKSNRS